MQPPVGPASAIDALAVPTSNSDAAVVVTMANIAPNTVTINHARLLELLIKEAAHDEAQKKAFQDAINLSQPSPLKFVADVNECHFANIFPELAGELSIFSPLNYRSRHSQTDPNWKQLQGYPFSRVQKMWFAGQMLNEDLNVDYRAGDTRPIFCKRYGIPVTTANSWLKNHLSERSFTSKQKNRHKFICDRSVPLFTMNHDGFGRPNKISDLCLLDAFKEIEQGSATDRGGAKQSKSHLEYQEVCEIFKRYDDHPHNPTSFVLCWFFNP